MADRRIELRAERLAILLLALGEEPTMDLADAFSQRMVPRGWYGYMSDADLGLEPGDLAADVMLALECASLAHELRARQWTALERTDALLFGGEPGARLEPEEQHELARAIVTLGWDQET